MLKKRRKRIEPYTTNYKPTYFFDFIRNGEVKFVVVANDIKEAMDLFNRSDKGNSWEYNVVKTGMAMRGLGDGFFHPTVREY